MRRRRSSATSATWRTSGPRAENKRDDLVDPHLLAQGHAGQDLGHGAAGLRRRRPGVDRRDGCTRPAGRSSRAGGGSSPPEHQAASRASPSASEASSTAKRTAGSSQRPGIECERRGRRSGAGPACDPAASVAARRTSSAGQARSGFTWSAVTGETPPQSSMPASSSGARSSERLGGACTWTSGGRTRRATAMAQRSVLGWAGGRLGHGRPRLGQEVLHDHLLHVPVTGVRRGDGAQRGQAIGRGCRRCRPGSRW